MRRFLAQIRARAETAELQHTTFCEACSSVCTPASRYEARREAERQSIYRSGLIRPF